MTFFGFLVFPFFGSAHAGYDDGMNAYRKAQAAFSTHAYEEARRWAEQALKADPENPHAQAMLGDLAFLAQEPDGARRAWERALALEPRLRALKERLEQVKQELSLQAGHARHHDRFRISLPGRTDAPLNLQRSLDDLQQAREFLEARFQSRLKGPIRVLIYDPKTFSGSFHVPTEVAGLFDGQIRLPLSRVSGAEPDRAGWPSLRAIIWHELAHAAVHQLAQAQAPRWVHEGVAQAVQAQVEPIPTQALRLALRRREAPSIAQLEGRSVEVGQTSPMEAGVFYQTAWSHVAYLLEHRGWTGVRQFLEILSTGVSTTEALAQLTNMDEETLRRQWQRWAQARLDGVGPLRNN